MAELKLMGPFKVGTFRGRPAVFKAPTTTPNAGGGYTLGVGFPVAIVSDAVANPELIAGWIAAACNAHDVACLAQQVAEAANG